MSRHKTPSKLRPPLAAGASLILLCIPSLLSGSMALQDGEACSPAVSGSVSSPTAVVLAPLPLVCTRGPHQGAAIAAMQFGAEQTWDWDHLGSKAVSVLSRVQDVFAKRPETKVVIVPGVTHPYRASYYRRLQSSASGESGEPLLQAAAWVLAPYDRMYTTAVELCRHYGWQHVVIMSSDDYHLRTAQNLRKRLTAAGIHIFRHQVFSNDDAETASLITHDLDAIQTSRVRVVFLLGSCSASHAILSSARRKRMQRGYAWILLHPSGHCPLPSSESSATDMEVLETYQGVLALTWSGSMPRPMSHLPATKEAKEVLERSCNASCGSSSLRGLGTGKSGHIDPLDLSPRFLYDSLRLYTDRSAAIFSSALIVEHEHDDEPTARPLPAHLRTEAPTASEPRRLAAASVTASPTTAPDVVDVKVVSFLGARREGTGAAAHVEVLYQPVAQLSSSMDGSPTLELLSSRPIRWPGDVHEDPLDLAGVDMRDLRSVNGWGLENGSGVAAMGAAGAVYTPAAMFLVAAICIALTPVWTWLFKALRGRRPPPCVEPCYDKASVAMLDDKEARVAAKTMIDERFSQLTERQMDLLRSVEVQMSQVQSKNIVGTGSFSVVFKGYYHNSHVAIKVLKKVDEKNLQRFLDEIMLHKDLRHPNIVMFRGASWAEGRLIMLVDYAGRGTLADVLRKSRGSLKWNPVKLNMALGIARGMAFLHDARYYDMWSASYQHCIVHRDLKPQNILVTDSYHVLITDFGEARTITREETMTQVGTQLYCAPEVVRGERYSEKCDVYSFAIVMLAMLELKPDVLDVFAECLPDGEKEETGITEDRLREPQGVEATDACKSCPLNKAAPANIKDSVMNTLSLGPTLVNGHPQPPAVTCPLAKHRAFKGVVANSATRAVVYDQLRPKLPSAVAPSLRSMIEICWAVEPEKRPSFSEIVSGLETPIRNEIIELSARAAEAKRKEQELEMEGQRRRLLFSSNMGGGGALETPIPSPAARNIFPAQQPYKPVLRLRPGQCPA